MTNTRIFSRSIRSRSFSFEQQATGLCCRADCQRIESPYSCQLRVQDLDQLSILVHIEESDVVNAVPLDLLPGHPPAT